MKPIWLALTPLTFGLAACGTRDVTGPNGPPALSSLTAIALGSRFSCVITDQGKPYCWGDGLEGQIGDSSYTPRILPTAGVGGHSYIAIAAGDASVCALDRAGVPWCWGDATNQPLLRISIQSYPSSVVVPRPLTSITVGHRFGCGLDDAGLAYCWGENSRGQLGVADTIGRESAARVAGDLHFTMLSAGYWHVCGLTTSGNVFCWGDNTFGELATGDTAASPRPQQVQGSATFRFITSGSIHSCGIATNGHTLCWGANFSGQLGDGTQTRRLAPTEAAPGLVFSSIRAERANSIFTHTCGATAAGEVYCWGWNSKTQLGGPRNSDPCTNTQGSSTLACSYAPVRVTGISGVSALDAGLEHTCVISGQDLYCWGDNSYGQLGDGTSTSEPVPVLVKGGLRLP